MSILHPSLRHYIAVLESAAHRPNRKVTEIRKTPAIPERPDAHARMAGRDASGAMIGRVAGYEVRLDDAPSGSVTATVVGQDGKAVGYADFIKAPAEHYHIKMIRLLKGLRGKRIIPNLLLLMASRGGTIVSDREQSPEAVKMWSFLFDEAPKHGCEVFALDHQTGETTALTSPTKTVGGKALYGAKSPYRLALAKHMAAGTRP